MKLNKTGKYITEEGKNYIEDPETHEKHLFFIDRKNRLVIRSFLEDDIKPFVQKMDATGKEKRQKMKILYEEIPKKNSEAYFFAIERILGKEKEDRWNEIYELGREPIGLGIRAEDQIEVFLYTKEEQNSLNVLNLLKKVGDHFDIQGKGWIMPCKE